MIDLINLSVKGRGYKEIYLDLLNQYSKLRGKKLVFNVTWRPAYSKLKHILSNVNLLLGLDAPYCQAFLEVPIVSFKSGKSFKYLLVRAKILVEKERDGKFCGCQGKHCEICTFQKKKTLLLTKRVAIHIR